MIDRDLIGFVPNRDVWWLQQRLDESVEEERETYRAALADMNRRIENNPKQRAWVLEGLSRRVATLLADRYAIADWETRLGGGRDNWYIVVEA